MGTKRCIALWGVALGLAVSACWAAATNPDTRPRRPLAAAFLDGAKTVIVANRSGSVSVVDVAEGRVTGEFRVGERLADLAVLPDRKHILLVDEGRNELLALVRDGDRLSVRARLAVADDPASVVVAPDGRQATVAGLWSRRLDVVDLTPLSTAAARPALAVVHAVRLPFAPRCQCVLPGGTRVVVADAFGESLAVVDTAAGRIVALHRLEGHNLRGLAVDAGGTRLLIAHQIIDQKAPVTRQNIERGVLMANVVRTVPLDRLEDDAQILKLGEVGNGAADPAGLLPLAGGRLAVALAGVHEVALLGADGKASRRIHVGRRPTAVIGGKEGQPLISVNTFDDSLSVLDPATGDVRRTIPLGPPARLGPADRGEVLFFDGRLARDGWMSCHSCHTDGHTNGLLADTSGDNTFGTPKRTLTLRGTALTDPWAWNGEVKYLHDQVDKSLRETMHAPAVRAEEVTDLVSYLHTLPPPPPPEPVTADAADRARLERGRQFFHDRGCVGCHIPPLTYSSHDTHDVGFADERGLRRFNPPSLRGVGQGYRFLHDNRAATLDEVFTRYHHKVGPHIAPDDLADLRRFLRSL
jgi:DNA-binding beta-propeller fold protein YncE/cytochrome c peroxidase